MVILKFDSIPPSIDNPKPLPSAILAGNIVNASLMYGVMSHLMNYSEEYTYAPVCNTAEWEAGNK